jgi:hypothetical protein
MAQSGVIRHVAEAFVGLIAEFCGQSGLPAPLDCADPSTPMDLSAPCAVCVALVGIAERRKDNMMNRIQVKRDRGDGTTVEVLMKPPSTVSVSFAVVFAGADQLARLEAIGAFLSFCKDHAEIPVGEFDWAGNGGRPIFLQAGGAAPESSGSLPESLRGMAAYTFAFSAEIGIDAPAGQSFVRVKERQVSAVKKSNNEVE